MPNETAYVEDIYFGRGRVRVRFSSDGPDVTAFLVQLEALDGDTWKAVRRYDDRHGAPHLDYLDRTGREYRKEWLELNRNGALTVAIRDFMVNGERYIEEFLEGGING